MCAALKRDDRGLALRQSFLGAHEDHPIKALGVNLDQCNRRAHVCCHEMVEGRHVHHGAPQVVGHMIWHVRCLHRAHQPVADVRRHFRLADARWWRRTTRGRGFMQTLDAHTAQFQALQLQLTRRQPPEIAGPHLDAMVVEMAVCWTIGCDARLRPHRLAWRWVQMRPRVQLLHDAVQLLVPELQNVGHLHALVGAHLNDCSRRQTHIFKRNLIILIFPSLMEKGDLPLREGSRHAARCLKGTCVPIGRTRSKEREWRR